MSENSSAPPHHHLEEYLKKALDSEKYYDAYMLYVSISQKLLKQNKKSQAQKLLVEGVQKMADAGQMKSATDLSNRLLGSFSQPWDQESVSLSLEALKALNLYKPFVDKILSSATFSFPKEKSKLHLAIAALYSQEGSEDYEYASQHFVLAKLSDVELHIQMLTGAFDKIRSEPESFVELLASAVLKYLKKKRLDEAYQLNTRVLEHVRTACPTLFASVDNNNNNVSSYKVQNTASCSTSVYLSTYPLLNFLQLLIVTLQRNSSSCYVKLKTHYRPLLSPSSQKDLDEIQRIYYSPPSSTTTSNNGGASFANNFSGIFENVIRGFFGDSSATTNNENRNSSRVLGGGVPPGESFVPDFMNSSAPPPQEPDVD